VQNQIAALAVQMEASKKQSTRTRSMHFKFEGGPRATLRLHANEFGLTKEDGNPNEQGIQEVAKIANWDTKGVRRRRPQPNNPPAYIFLKVPSMSVDLAHPAAEKIVLVLEGIGVRHDRGGVLVGDSKDARIDRHQGGICGPGTI
jgi:hypothetical protein